MVFYYANMIAPKGPLGVVWIASTLDRQLKRNQIMEANITSSVDQILATEFPQLRLSSQLLLGVVRIYSRKVSYLYQECNDALVSIRDVSQRPTPGKNDKNKPSRAAPAPVSLPDNFELEDIASKITLPANAIPHMDLQMGASTSMAAGSQPEALFGSNFTSTYYDQFEVDANLPYDLAEEDFLLMRSTGVGEAGPSTQAGAAAHTADDDLFVFDIDLGIDFNQTEMQEVTETGAAAAEEPPSAARSARSPAAGGADENQGVPADTPTVAAEDHAPASGDATPVPDQAAPAEQAAAQNTEPAGAEDGAPHAVEETAVTTAVPGEKDADDAATRGAAANQADAGCVSGHEHELDVSQPEPATQGDDATQPELATQGEDATQATQTETGTQAEDGTQGELATQETEDGRKPRRSSRRSAAARAGDTPLPMRELRKRGSSAAAASEAGSQAEMGSQAEAGSSQQSGSSRGSQRPGVDFLIKRKNIVVDEDAKTKQPILIVPGQLQRKLLEDRSAILVPRGKRQKVSHSSAWPTDNPLLDTQAGPLYRPSITTSMSRHLHQAIFTSMSKPLQQVYCISMNTMDAEELVTRQRRDKKSPQKAHEEEEEQQQAPTEQHEQTTNTAEPTNTDININEHSSMEPHPPVTPASAPAPSHLSHQDHFDEDPSVMPTPEVSRLDERGHERGEEVHDREHGQDAGVGEREQERGEGEAMEATPSAAPPVVETEVVGQTPHADDQPVGAQDEAQAQNETPAPVRRRQREELVYEDLGEPLPPHVHTDLTVGGADDDAEAANDTVTAKSFTRRTRVVVAAIKAAMDHADKGKRQKSNNAEARRVPTTLHLSSFVKGHNRLHASRWFFELLVLKAKGVVELDQTNPYADMGIEPTHKLAEVTAN